MRKYLFAFAAALCIMSLGGCSKDASKDIVGSYTYKTSGTVTLMASKLAGLDAATLAAYKAAGVNVDPVVVGLYPEQGQMHVIAKDGSANDVIITFNDLLGNADVTEGVVNGNALTLSSGNMKAAQLTDGKEKIGAGIVAYSGSGRKYDDVLIIGIEYQGVFTIDGVEMTVIASDINCVAQAN